MTRAVASHRHFALVFLYGYCDDFVQHFFDAGHLWQHRTSCPRYDSVLDTTCKILHCRPLNFDLELWSLLAVCKTLGMLGGSQL